MEIDHRIILKQKFEQENLDLNRQTNACLSELEKLRLIIATHDQLYLDVNEFQKTKSHNTYLAERVDRLSKENDRTKSEIK